MAQTNRKNQMTKHFCDQCGNEMPFPYHLDLTLPPPVNARQPSSQRRFELCETCVTEINKMVDCK